jgi:hypothetical protein
VPQLGPCRSRSPFAAGASLDPQTLDGSTCAALCITRYAFIHLHNRLHQHGADVDAADNTLATPLHKCCQFSHSAVVSLLLDVSASVNSREKINGRTPLHCAARSGCQAAILPLVLARADINAVDAYNRTALHESCWAASAAHVAVRHVKQHTIVIFPLFLMSAPQVTSSLIMHAADVSAVELLHSWTPLHVASRWGRCSFRRKLSARKLENC